MGGLDKNMQGIIILIISSIVFDIVLVRMYKSNPQVFSIFDKIPQNWKRKWYIKWIFLLILYALLSIIQVSLGISEVIGYIIAGIIFSLCSFAFRKPQEE